jgi:hypothetical protein
MLRDNVGVRQNTAAHFCRVYHVKIGRLLQDEMRQHEVIQGLILSLSDVVGHASRV